MRKFKALPTKENVVNVHGKVLEKREKNRQRIKKLYEYMKE